MNTNFNRKFFAVCAGVFLAARIFAQDTNVPAAVMSTLVTRDEVADNYLHIQEQIHATQLAIESNQQAAADLAQSNANVLAARLQSLEQSVARQRIGDAEAARKTQQLTMFMAGAFGLVGLGIMLLMVYFQWRAFTQLAQISSRQYAAIANGDSVHQLAGPGRATVAASTAQLLDVVSRLEQRISELEGGQKMLPEIAATRPSDPGIRSSDLGARPSDLLAEGQRHLDANSPVKALDCFDKYLAAHPGRADGLVKRAGALEKLGREDEALECYNRAIAADGTLVIAHLHKGGLLNRLRRYDEALNCYERALLAQDKKAGAKQNSAN
jgi:tetratricopeptide (TPR) repeat protein